MFIGIRSGCRLWVSWSRLWVCGVPPRQSHWPESPWLSHADGFFSAGVLLGGGFLGRSGRQGLAWPVPTAGFCSVPAPRGLLFAGVGEAFGAGTPVPPGAFGAFGSSLGTLGSRCERMSAARMGSGPLEAERELSAISVMTSTSSSRLRSAAGLILMARNGSLSWSGVDADHRANGIPFGINAVAAAGDYVLTRLDLFIGHDVSDLEFAQRRALYDALAGGNSPESRRRRCHDH